MSGVGGCGLDTVNKSPNNAECERGGEGLGLLGKTTDEFVVSSMFFSHAVLLLFGRDISYAYSVPNAHASFKLDVGIL